MSGLHLRLMAVTAATVALLCGCGNKQDPVPPPSLAPAPTTELTVQQRGAEVLLALPYPTTTVSGLALPGLQAVEVWELRRPVPEPTLPETAPEAGEIVDGTVEASEEPITPGEPAAEPAEAATDLTGGAEIALEEEPPEAVSAEPAVGVPGVGASETPSAPGGLPTAEDTGDTFEEEPEAVEAPAAGEGGDLETTGTLQPVITIDPREFDAAATLRMTIEGAELDAAIAGDRIVTRLPLDLPLPDPPEAHIFAVKTVSTSGEPSAFSQRVVLVPAPAPAAPAVIHVAPRSEGIEIEWSIDAGDLAGFNIYRRDARSRYYDLPLRSAAAEVRSFLDKTASYGGRYFYTVTAVATRTPLIESAVVVEQEVDYQDLFAPEPPTNLVALAERSRIRLLWDPSESVDVAGYLIERREGDGDFETLNREPAVSSEFIDDRVTLRRRYRYRIRAIDEVGNLGEPSAEVEAEPR